MKMGQAIYSQEQASAQGSDGTEAASESSSDEDVVDAEFSEVDEDAKN